MTIKLTKSPGFNIEKKEKREKEQYNPNPEMQEIYGYYHGLIQDAKDQRALRRTEFDDLTYEEDYELNKRAANAYLAPKENDDEVRIVTGVTEKKIEVIYNELLTMNLQPEVIAYDQDDNLIKELGRDISDIVDRTNQIERDDDFWKLYVRELITQRAAFLEEADEYITCNNRGKFNMGDKGEVVVKKEKKYETHRARKKFISGLQVYLGDINLSAYRFQEQPYIIKYYRKTYREARAVYGEWKNWKYVKPGMSQEDEPYWYRMNALDKDEIEEIHILDGYNDEFMIIINGVMMFDEPAPLPYEITPDRRYNIVMSVLKDMGSDFSYGKPLTASAKTLQGLNSEMIRLLIKKWRQVIEPPMGTRSSKIYSRDIWTAGAVVHGAKENDFFLLNPGNQGITSGEFNMYDLIEKKTEEFIGAGNTAQGIGEKGSQTATEVLNQQRQFIKQLGLSVLSFMQAKRDATYLRIYNLVENHFEPVKKQYDPVSDKIYNIYRKFTLTNAIFENGKRGKKIIQLSDQKLTREEKENIYSYEQREEAAGRPIKIRLLYVDELKKLNLLWYVVVNQREREGTALSKVMFQDKFNQAVSISQITGRPVNADKLIEDYEFTWQVKDMFKQAAPAQNQAPNNEVAQEGNELLNEINKLSQSEAGKEMTEGARAGAGERPSLNSLEGQSV